jgi:SET domain-containing protein
MNLNQEVLLQQIRQRPRVNGYTALSTETKVSPIHELGLFATENISERTLIAAWGGHIRTRKEVAALPPEIGNKYALEIYPEFYLTETRLEELDAADFINHSCEPNCHLKHNVMLASRTIIAGEELTADFSSPSATGIKTTCTCGAKNCKGFVFF